MRTALRGRPRDLVVLFCEVAKLKIGETHLKAGASGFKLTADELTEFVVVTSSEVSKQVEAVVLSVFDTYMENRVFNHHEHMLIIIIMPKGFT